ncbi:WD domain-containing protein [Zalerion maritima]|uniref:WD domain-containing protein n=1 Tax=Zalerion maritima TaxID=339359 RepID=A0AAD5RU51_9PEZI|nr:WD domain-containing protein [Zalerion maritima]
MGPDPDEYNPGSFPLYDDDHHPPSFSEDVLMMSNAHPQSLHQHHYSLPSPTHHNHTQFTPTNSNHHQYQQHPFDNTPVTVLSAQPLPGYYEALPIYDGPIPPQFPWPILEHGFDIPNDEETSLSAIHHALDAMSPSQDILSESPPYPMYEGHGEEDASVEMEATANPSPYLSQFPHHQPLPQPAVPSPQPISLDAGSWPTTVPSPGQVPPAPLPPGHSVNPTGAAVSVQLQQLQNLQAIQEPDSDEENLEGGDNDDDEPSIPAPMPPPPPQIPLHAMLGLSQSNINTLGPDNPSFLLFLRRWIYSPRVRTQPILEQVEAQADEPERVVHYGSLEGDKCDMQGINWHEMGTTRRDARLQRRRTYRNYVNRPNSDCWEPAYDTPRDVDYFRFRRMDIKHNVHLAHFQLRNDLSCVSRSLAFYPSVRSVQQINPVSGKSTVALDLKDVPNIQISTLSAKNGALVVGGFNGDYYVKSLDSIQEKEPGHHEGQLTVNTSGITNHVQLWRDRRSDAPLASFASNDLGFRTLDIATDKLVSQTVYDFPINCSAISPDRRLRVMVGDHNDVVICNSETNEVLQKLRSHRDFGFACDWSENGWSVATGFQDMMVKIWDARKWTGSNGDAAPVTTIKTNMSGARSLRFSPLGSGKPTLIAAEEADYLNIIDAETYGRRQVLDLFGEIGGVDFANDGRDLMVLCSDPHRGGLMRLERTRDTLSEFYDSDAERGVEKRNRTIYSRRRVRAACPVDLDLF